MKIHRQLFRLLRISMRVSIYQLVIALIFAGVSLADDAHGQDMLNQKITINANNESIKEVLRQLNKLTSVRFTYNSTLLLADRRVTIAAVNKPLHAVLDEIFVPLQINYVVQNKLILLKQADSVNQKEKSKNSVQPEANLRAIHGKVKEQKAGVLPGVSIVIKGTQRGTVTNENGEFNIELQPEDSVLVFSFVGYKTLEENINNRSEILAFCSLT